MKHKKIICLSGFLILSGIGLLVAQIFPPRLERAWVLDQSQLPSFEQENSLVHIYNVRNFSYTPEETKIHYYDKSFDLEKI